MEKYICVHGHFYQPPRENPWLETLERQPSAHPYHDWNDRITAECYATNAASRILDPEGRIERITSNYVRMSFNFGPPLLAWMEEGAPEVYAAILKADQESRERFNGHGSALAQAYNHLIMPLANRRDKETQVRWGVRDFEHRFGRSPEGMWLPETAVDLETLDILADHGILFTILAQRQARRVRKIGTREWTDVSGGSIDPTTPYRVLLPSGRSLNVFFYDGPISQAVAFEDLLSRGENLAQRIQQGFSQDRPWPQLVHIATDGETYGHHHPHGDMALAYALDLVEREGWARLTNYGEFLELNPPSHEAEIIENTNWSCIHGVERWRTDCGCHSGGHPEWSQAWRAPLREALEWLRDVMAVLYKDRASEFLGDPWAARNDYIDLVLDRSRPNLSRFLTRHATRDLEDAELTRALEWLELQRHAMLMFTSCGWFFDELSGIETVQVIEYAGRVVQLGEDASGAELEEPFLERLSRAPSNLPEHENGRRIYEKWVQPAMLDLHRVGAHYAMSSLFEDYAEETDITCFHVLREDYQAQVAGRAKLAVGRARVTSRITWDTKDLRFAVLHMGDHNIHCGIAGDNRASDFGQMQEDIRGAFCAGDFPEAILHVERWFGDSTYSLKSLFRDQQHKIAEQILEPVLSDAESSHRQLFEHYAPLMRFLSDTPVPLPGVFRIAADFVLNTDLRRRLGEDDPDPDAIGLLLQEARQMHVDLDHATLEFELRQSLERTARALRKEPDSPDLLERMVRASEVVRRMPFDVHLFTVQNIAWEITRDVWPDLVKRSRNGDRRAAEAVKHYHALAEPFFRFQPLQEVS